MFGKARASLEAAKPDVILIFDTDHYNTFFFDNFPIFAIGIDDRASAARSTSRAAACRSMT